MENKTVLFVCVHNSARSQMAKAYLKKFGFGLFLAESAGLEAGTLNPLAVQVMIEDGINISQNKTKTADSLLNEGRTYTYVITVCDESNAERCPVFPGMLNRLHWSFADPSKFTGTLEEQLQQTRIVRDEIKKAVFDFLNTYGQRKF